MPVRFWHSDELTWEMPYEDLSLLIDKLNEDEYKIVSNPDVFKQPEITESIPEDYEFKTKPYQHQIEGVEYGLSHKKFLLGDEQGCVDGDMLISFNVGGGSRVRRLSELYKQYQKSSKKDDYSVRCLKDGVFGLNSVQDIVYSGEKPVYKLTLEDGKSVNTTADHEILTDNGFKPLEQLKVGDTVITNGEILRCPKCGTTEDLITYKYGKFYGYCRKCMYLNRDGTVHNCTKHFQKDHFHANGNLIVMVPKQSKIVSIEYVGIKDTYDIKMQDPYRNFIANSVVVHNCGKSKQMIDLACIKKQTLGYKHCLIIACVNGLKYNWQEEVKIHSNETGHILGSYTNKKGQLVIGSNERRLQDLQNLDKINSYFIITNIETLRYNRKEKVPCKNSRNGVTRTKTITVFPIVDEIQRLVKAGEIGMIVADEVHRCLDRDTLVQTDKGLIKIKDIVDKRCYKVATRLDNGEIDYVLPANYFRNPNPVIITELQIQCFDKSNIQRIYCTHNHKFLLADNTYEEAQFLQGKELINGNKVLNISIRQYDDYVYDIEIPDTHNYILDGNIVVHNCKDSTSLQGKALLSLNADSVVALTGTPLMNNAIDLFTPLKFIGKEQHSLFAFKQHYCICGGFGGHQIVGYKNLPELQSVLDKCMLRRLKKDVLDLPEKIHINDYVEMTPSQSKIYMSILDDLRQNIDKVKLSPNPLVMLTRLRQATGNPEILSSEAKGNPKYDRMLELIEDLVSEGKKSIVFSNWTNVLNPAYELLQKNGFNPALYTGENTETRESEKQRFKKDSSCKVICGTIGAMGTGLTLTEATTIIFLDEPWNRAIKDQAEDRAHRIGTTENLTIITLICKDTIDERINSIVYRKGKMSDIIVDKQEDLYKNPQVLNYLLS